MLRTNGDGCRDPGVKGMGTGSRGVRNPQVVRGSGGGGGGGRIRGQFRTPGGRMGYVETRECRGWKTR